MWEQQFQDLTDFHCLAPDLPGHGLSGATPWHSIGTTADLVATVIRTKVPAGRAHIVGLSLGAYVGLELLAHHQDVVDHAVLSGMNIKPLPGKWLMNAAAYLDAPLLKTH